MTYFDPAKAFEAGRAVRRQWKIPEDAVVIGNAGRLTRDKGIAELVSAFDSLAQRRPDCYLLLVGPDDARSPLPTEISTRIARHDRIRAVGRQSDMPAFYAAMDIFVLPSYREGFGVVNLEAAAMELPVVTTDTTGVRESIEDEVTGLLVPVARVPELEAAMERLAADPELRRRLGRAGRQRVQDLFEQGKFWDALYRHRRALLEKAAHCAAAR
jgi:glycosyltransferase involved in cell wall biosynthesis